MQDAIHVKAFRLFEQAQAQAAGREFQLLDWEETHFRECAECQAVFAVFAHQVKERLPSMFSNGEINPADGYYKNLCCGLECYMAAGTVFPDCDRHEKLPTVWRLVKEEQGPATKSAKE